MTPWHEFAILALDHMRWHAQAPYVVTVKEFNLTLIGRPIHSKTPPGNDNG